MLIRQPKLNFIPHTKSVRNLKNTPNFTQASLGLAPGNRSLRPHSQFCGHGAIVALSRHLVTCLRASIEMDKPQLWIIREKTEWPTNEFLTLFAEEGYETIDFDAKSISRAIEPDKPFGMISNVLLPYSLISVLSNAITYSVLDEICTRSLLGKLQFLKCIIFYDPPSFEFLSDYELEGVEILVHYSTAVIRGEVTSRKNFKVCGYADRPGFCNPNLPSYDKVTTRIAYSATLKLLRETLGPQFDLEKVSPRAS